MNLRRLLGIKTRQEGFDALPESMSDDERLIICSIIRSFLDDTLGDREWDWLMTGPKESKEAERISEFCCSIDFIFPALERHMFTSESGEAALRDLLKIIEDEAHSFESVCICVDALNARAEAGTGQSVTRLVLKLDRSNNSHPEEEGCSR